MEAVGADSRGVVEDDVTGREDWECDSVTVEVVEVATDVTEVTSDVVDQDTTSDVHDDMAHEDMVDAGAEEPPVTETKIAVDSAASEV